MGSEMCIRDRHYTVWRYDTDDAMIAIDESPTHLRQWGGRSAVFPEPYRSTYAAYEDDTGQREWRSLAQGVPYADWSQEDGGALEPRPLMTISVFHNGPTSPMEQYSESLSTSPRTPPPAAPFEAPPDQDGGGDTTAAPAIVLPAKAPWPTPDATGTFIWLSLIHI